MVYVIQGTNTTNGEVRYLVKSSYQGKAKYYLTSRLEGCATWKSRSGAARIFKAIASSKISVCAHLLTILLHSKN